MLDHVLRREGFAGRLARGARNWWLDQFFTHKGVVKVVNGIPMRVSPGYRYKFTPDYDATVAKYLRSRVAAGMTCVNVGANVGIYVLQFAAWSAPNGHIVAFEPNPAVAAVLRQHVQMNELSFRVRVVQCAVSSSPGTASFNVVNTDDGMSRLGSPQAFQDNAHPIQVEVTTLDKFCEREQVRPDCVLIDVEGFEAAVLEGFQKTMAARRAVEIVVEMHPNAWHVAGSNRDGFQRLLDRCKLRPIALTGQHDPMADYGLVRLERVKG